MFKLLSEILGNSKKKVAKKKAVMFETLDDISLKYQKHPLSRTIKITIKSYNNALVTMPRNFTFKEAKLFVRANLPWLKTCFEKFEIKEKPKKADVEILRKRAKEILPPRVEYLAVKFGFKYKNLRFKNVKTRWGSCSFDNNINLNLNLVLLDDELIEYVILHELTHTIVKNHSEKFWDLLQKNLPNAIEIRKKLKKISI